MNPISFLTQRLRPPRPSNGYLSTPAALHEPAAASPDPQASRRMHEAEDAQRVMAQAMSDSEERFRQLADSVTDVFWIYEPQSERFLYVSPAYERDWMRSAKALYADTQEWTAPVHADDREALRRAFGQLAHGSGYAMEYRVTLKGGQDCWVAERAFPVASRSGQMPRFAGISQDVTARKNADLQLLRDGRHKDEFLAMLAHELRNPLEPIRSAAALLALRHAQGPAAEQKAVSVILRQVNHLGRLVDDLLDISRITHGKIRLRTEVIRLRDVIDAAVDANRSQAAQRGLRLRVELPGGDPWVHGDPVRLTQVFSNLLHNAVKFSPPGGAVTVTLRAGAADVLGGPATVSVRDEGCGIAPGLLDSVFDLFTQDEPSAAREHGGLGIGLAIVRSLTHLHGGQVTVTSGGAGMGCEFVVTLPTAQPPAAMADKPPVAASRPGRRILVVDDNRDAAESMQALLEMDGHSVALAFNGQEALDQAARLRPEIVVLDIGLPDINGCEVARRLKADTSLPALVLVALTGYGRAQDLRDVRAAGFDHHFVKPTDPTTLMELLAG